MNQKAIRFALVLVGAVGCSSTTADSANPTPSSPGGTVRKAYVGLFGDQAVAVLDTSTNKVLTTIPVTALDGLVITPDGKKVYVASTDSGTVKVIATETDAVIGSIPVGAKAAGLTITPDGRHVVASVGGANEVVILDTSTDAVVSQTTVGAAHSSGISADGRYAYVGSQVTTAPAVVVVDITGATPPVTFRVDKSPRALAWTSWGKLYFSAVGVDALEVMDLTTGALGTPIPTGGSPHDTRPTVDGKFELVVSQTVGDLELVDPSTNAVAAKIPTGKMPHWIALTADGAQAYVTNEGDDNLVVVDLAKRAVVATVAIGKAPRKMALQP
jgi:YVTN family beta-propeller protein